MRDSLLNRRVLLKVGGAGFVGGMMSTASATASEGTGNVTEISGFENPQPITDNSNRLQLVTPANRLIIDAETDDIIDLVFEWDESLTIEERGFSRSGSMSFTDRDIAEHRAVFRGAGRADGENTFDKLAVTSLDTSNVEPGDEVDITVSARQADSPEDTDEFEDVVEAVDNDEFDHDVTAEATFEITQGTLISADDSTTALDIGPDVDHTIAFSIDQLRDENAGGDPAGPAVGISVNYSIDSEDGLTFDFSDADVTLGEAAENLDLEVVKDQEIPEFGSVLFKIEGNTFEDGADLTVDDTVTIELSGIDTSNINPDDLDEYDSWVEVGVHAPATFDPIVDEPLGTLRGGYASALIEFDFGEQTGLTEIEDWHDLDGIRDELDDDYVFVADLDEDSPGYDDIASETANDDSGFEPIGDTESPFTGSISGRGHTVSGLTIDRPETDAIGLFRATEHADIADFYLSDVDIIGKDRVAGLVAEHFVSTTTGVEVSGSVDGQFRVGGLIGQNIPSEGEELEDGDGDSSEIHRSVFTGTVSGETAVGGLIGDNRGTVTETSASGSVTGDDEVGGLVGIQTGIAGSLERSFVDTDVTATGPQVGGLIGYQSGETTAFNSFVDGSVEATGESATAGGFVGELDTDCSINQSYVLGSVTADDANSLGGFAGESTGSIVESYTATEVHGTADNIGGFIGDVGGSQEDSYWDTELSGQDDSSNAEGLSTDEMTGDAAVDNMDGFDFDTVWQSQTDPAEYPSLQIFQQDDSAVNFVVTIRDPDDGGEVREDEQLDVTVAVTNTGSEPGTQDIELTAPIQETQASVELAGNDETEIEITIPESEVEGTFDIIVESDDTTDAVSVTAVDPCFIATAAYNTPQAAEIDVLREFRDTVLNSNPVGRAITKLYYATSPPVANWIRQTKQRRRFVRRYFVGPLVRTVEKLQK